MRFRLNEDKYFADVTDGIAVVINIETGVYYGLNLLTTNIYENITSGVDTDELLAALSKIKGYNESIKAKYLEFLNKLITGEFIEEDKKTSSTAVHINFDEYRDEELDFVLSEYRDAAELLLADPIHQVKAELGWKPDMEALK